MSSLMKVTGLVIAAVVIAAGAIYFTGNTMNLMIALFKPRHGFDLSRKAPAPDYSDAASWAALPETEDLADLVPEGIAPRDDFAPVDVFFIHPTGYLHGHDWNSVMDPESITEENTKWMMANQASPYNSCCNVFAPRYREASIFAYLAGDEEMQKVALDFAYQDVERAFSYFLEHRSQGRPFIIASHSQGTHHGTTLLKRRIAGTPLRDRMIAAYIIGGGTMRKDLEEMPGIAACDGPTDFHCVIHWATFGEGGTPDDPRWDAPLVCTNPLTWRDEGGRARADLHEGGVPSSGEFNLSFFGRDEATGVEFGPLGEPVTSHTWAECRDGFLFVEEQTDTAFGRLAGMPGKNYHGLDYPLFHMDIRKNAIVRVAAFMDAAAAPSLAGEAAHADRGLR